MSGAKGGVSGMSRRNPKNPDSCTAQCLPALHEKDELIWGCDIAAHLKGIRETQTVSNHRSPQSFHPSLGIVTLNTCCFPWDAGLVVNEKSH